MIFSELRFFLFFAVVFSVYWALRRNGTRKVWLTAAGLAFYAAWDWRFLSLIVYQTGVDYIAANRIEATPSDKIRKRWLLVSLISNLGLLGVFKYLNFFASSFIELANGIGMQVSEPTLHIVLPVGISFYTFQSLSYTIDVYRRHLVAVKRVTDFAFFVTFFPQLVAGPIVRAIDFLDQVVAARDPRRVDWRWGLTLFLTGFFKKACISDNISPFIDAFYRHPAAYDTPSAWLATVMYGVQIYCDFSGYTDMAIACAGLLGYRLCPNFAAPYLSLDITAFWRRWHMSLSSWLKDYLYISLGGNRGSKIFTYRNLFLTMLLGGLWHGASWNFVLWGSMHGVALIIHKIWRERVGSLGQSLPARIAGWSLTVAWVFAAWIPFRATTFADTTATLRSLVGFTAPDTVPLVPSGAWLLAGMIAVLFAAHWLTHGTTIIREWWRRLGPVGYALVYGMAWSVVIALRASAYQPFIYFQF